MVILNKIEFTFGSENKTLFQIKIPKPLSLKTI